MFFVYILKDLCFSLIKYAFYIWHCRFCLSKTVTNKDKITDFIHLSENSGKEVRIHKGWLGCCIWWNDEENVPGRHEFEHGIPLTLEGVVLHCPCPLKILIEIPLFLLSRTNNSALRLVIWKKKQKNVQLFQESKFSI
jgi:hypothetical protein